MAALVAYRNLMRAARLAFQGDAPILSAAQTQIRSEFRQQLPSDSTVPDAIQRAEEVAKVLRENVVQGKQSDDEQDKYSAFVESLDYHDANGGQNYEYTSTRKRETTNPSRRRALAQSRVVAGVNDTFSPVQHM
ncbi:hypothetical protein G7046_g4118 [Stylonectria norvegica]|nr:hypothetical protein G7046_g4118 [Stylonectria norvegica]